MSNEKPNLPDENFVKRTFISMFSVEAISDYLQNSGIEISPETPLHSNPLIIQMFDIADIRLKNGIVVDVRAIVGEEYPQMCIPRTHFERGIAADIYVGLRIVPEREEAEITGFIKTVDISLNKGNENYFIISSEELKPIDDIAKTINSIDKKGKTFYALDHDKASSLFIPFIDNNIAEIDLNYLLEHIHSCTECREKLHRLMQLDSSLKKEKENLLLEEDYTLRLLASDPVLATDDEVSIPIEEEADEEDEVLPETDIQNFELEEAELTELTFEGTDISDEPEVLAKEEIKQENFEEEDILETLEDLETLEGEDIESLLSMFKSGEEKQEEDIEALLVPEPGPEPEIQEETVIPEPEEEKEQITEEVPILEDKKDDDIAQTIQEVTEKEETNDIFPEEEIPAAEEIEQEDLLDLFEETPPSEGVPPDSSYYEPLTDEERMQKAAHERVMKISTFVMKNKKMVAGSLGIAVCLVMLLNSIGKLGEDLKLKKAARENNQVVNQSNNNKTASIKRERTPIKSYTREIVKIVKPEKNTEIPEEILPKETKIVQKKAVQKPRELKIKHISWELPANIARDQKIKEYFLDIGQNLKTTLSKELYTAEVNAENSRINIYIELNRNGSIITSKITEESGIEKMDNICLSTINNLINKYKFPDSEIKQDKIKFLLLIRT